MLTQIPRPASLLFLCSCLFFGHIILGGPGTKIYNELVDTEGLYEEGGLDEYVAELGAKLVQYSDAGKRKFHFFVVDSPAVNAFATPDGYIFINRGLLMFLESEAQLAAVIGHEIGHVVREHGSKQRTADLTGALTGFVATLVTGRNEMMKLADAATKAYIAGYGREMELEADDFGSKVLARAGYNPMAVLESLMVLKDQSLFASEVRGQPATYHGLFSTHPQNDKRLHDIVIPAMNSLPEELIDPLGDFWTLIDGMKFGSEAQTGLLAQNIFFDKGARLVIEFPPNWFVKHNQDQVRGEATGGTKVAWATITRHAKDDSFKPKRFVRDTLKRTDLKEEETVQVNGRDAYLVELDMGEKKKSKDEEEDGSEEENYGEEESFEKYGLLGVVELGQYIYTVRGEIGERGSADTFKKDFLTILGGIRDMRPSDIKTDTSTKIKVIVAEPGMTYERLAQSTPLRSHGTQILRLLNGDYPRGEPRAGDNIKTVQ